MQLVLEVLSENLLLLCDAISENVWEDQSLIGQELVRWQLCDYGNHMLCTKYL